MRNKKSATVYVFINDKQKALDKINQLSELGVHVVGLPETEGPQACITQVTQAIKSYNDFTVVTMFPQSVNFIGELIEEGILNRETTSVVLDYNGLTSTHFLSEEGYLLDWPYGCMEPDTRDALRELNSMPY